MKTNVIPSVIPPQSTNHVPATQGAPSGIWWPYINPTVITFTFLVIIASIIFGALSGIISTSKGTAVVWNDWVSSMNLKYDFIWAEVTAGEGTLFWDIAVNGYDHMPRNIAKFPLYPGTVRGIWALSGHTMSVALLLWLVHQLMVWAGIAETYRFWENYHRGYGFRAILWLLSSPLITLHVWLFDFIEPGYIALVWLSLTLEKNHHWAASSTALLALTMLQPSGIILAFFIGIRRLWQWYQNKIPLSAMIWAWLPALIWIAWMVVTSIRFDRFLAPYTFQADWNRNVYRWPWDRWAKYIRYAIEVQFYWAHVITSVSLTWITIGYVWGFRLWLKLKSEQRHLLAGSWVMPLFSFLIVIVPFSTAVYGANRYALTTLLGIWPLLFSVEIQSQPTFRRYERKIWLIFLAVNLFVSFTIITDYGREWGVVYWP